jgi:hypothetical protein
MMTEASHLSSLNETVASYSPLLFQNLVYISGKLARRRRTSHKLHFFGRFFADVGWVGRLRVSTLIF